MNGTTKSEVVEVLAGMISEVLAEDDLGIDESTSFQEGLSFKSIELIALAELIQDRYEGIDFVTWMTQKDLAEVLALRVGDVADFIVTSSA